MKQINSICTKVLLFVFLVVITVLLRFYLIDQIPPALYQDETAIGYNAYSMLQTGRDEHNKNFPLYFESFGDYKLPAYIYATIPSIKVFGLNELGVRFPSALMGSITVVVLFLIIYALTNNLSLSFLTGFVLALNPWHIQMSRSGFEVNFALSFALIGLLFFLYSLKKMTLPLLLSSVLSFMISFYSYNATRLIVPLLICSIIFLYRKKIKTIQLNYLVIATSLLLLCTVPFIISILTPGGIFSAKTGLITSTDIIVKSLELRSYLHAFPHLYTRVFFSKYTIIAFQYMQNLVSSISPAFYFVYGSSHPNQGIGNYGLFYVYEFPFLLLGFLYLTKLKIHKLDIFLYWVAVCMLILGLSKEVPHATRGYFLVVPFTVFISAGLYYFSTLLYKASKYWRIAILSVLALFIFYNIQYYFLSYYYRFPFVFNKAWRLPEKRLAEYLSHTEKGYSSIIIDSDSDIVYTTILFYSKYSPQKFLSSVIWKKAGLLTTAKSFGKYEFRPINWSSDITLPHTLIVTKAVDSSCKYAGIKYIYEPVKYNFLSVNETVVNSVNQDKAYLIISTDNIKQRAFPDSKLYKECIHTQ